MTYSKHEYKDWLMTVTIRVDLGYLKTYPLCPENWSKYDAAGDISKYLFIGEVRDEEATLCNVYMNSYSFFKATELEKPDFFDEKYFQDLYDFYVYKVKFADVNKVVINKYSKISFGYNQAPNSRNIYGALASMKNIITKTQWAGLYPRIDYFSFLEDYGGMKFDSISSFLLKDYMDVFEGKVVRNCFVILAVFLMFSFYISPIALFVVALAIIYIYLIYRYAYVVKFNKINKHLKLAKQHEDLIDNGLAKILDGKLI